MRSNGLVAAAAAAAAVMAFGSAGSLAQDKPKARLGKVHLQVSCNAAAQSEFNVAMAYYHSFAWNQMREPLERAHLPRDGVEIHHSTPAPWLRSYACCARPSSISALSHRGHVPPYASQQGAG